MSYRTLLVGLADAETAPRVMGAAAALAREHEAHLLVVHVVPSRLTHQGEVPMANDTERVHAVYEQRRDELSFTSEWQVIDGSPLSAAAALIELGHACDAIVLGHRHGREAGRSRLHLGEHIIGSCARPVLLIPEDSGTDFPTGRALLAWDGSAVATRTVFETVPFLQHAGSVHLHRINPPASERHHVTGVAELLGAALARHGVSMELSHADAGRRQIGAAILECALHVGADTIVMGCQASDSLADLAQGQLREWLLGSTTRHVISHARCPVLLGA